MKEELSLQQMQRAWHGSLKAYLIGFFASLILTSISFLLVLGEMLPRDLLVLSISALALVQGVIQLKYFLHLGKEAKPRWETVIFYNMLLTLLIIVIGSLWVMGDLKQRTMSFHTEVNEHD